MNCASPHPKLSQVLSRIPRIVRTSVLEHEFKELALELGVHIIYRQVDDVDVILREYPGAVVVIGADGSHSMVRHQVFNNTFSQKQTFKHILELKYEVVGEGARKLRYFEEYYPTQKLLDYKVVETIGKHDQTFGSTAVTVRFVIPGTMYQLLKEATFKNPFRLPSDQHRIPSEVLEAITVWLNAREYCTGELRVEGSLRISTLHLSAYLADRVALFDEHRQVAFCLVGDAAFAVPFYRALNNGLKCGSKLAMSLYDFYRQSLGAEATAAVNSSKDQDLSPSEGPRKSIRWQVFRHLHKLHKSIAGGSLEAYDNFVQVLGAMEISIARIKSDYLFVASLVNRLNASVPWQVNRWDEQRIASFRSDLFSAYYPESVQFREVHRTTGETCEDELIQWILLSDSDLSTLDFEAEDEDATISVSTNDP